MPPTDHLLAFVLRSTNCGSTAMRKTITGGLVNAGLGAGLAVSGRPKS